MTSLLLPVNNLESSRQSVRKLKYKCPDCIEEDVTHPAVDENTRDFSNKLCVICGAALEVVTDESTTESEQLSEEELLGQLMDSLGVDMREMLEEHMYETSSTHKLSADFLKGLGSLIVDERSAALLDCHLRIGPLKMMGICSSFGNIPDSLPHALTRPVYIGEPKHGENPLTNLPVAGSIVVLHRGVVSFAAKTMRALEAQASALVVIQNSDKWPFQMADSAGDLLANHLPQGIAPIPVVMISRRDGALLESFLKSSWNASSGGGAYSKRAGGAEGGGVERRIVNDMTLNIGARSVECCICQESMVMLARGGTTSLTTTTTTTTAATAAAAATAAKTTETLPAISTAPTGEVHQQEQHQVVLKLPCRHVYHVECIHSWLESHTTCPMCRLDIAKETSVVFGGDGDGGDGSGGTAAATGDAGGDDEQQQHHPVAVRRSTRPARENGGQPYFV